MFFTVDPQDAKQLAGHTLPELDEHDLSHLDRYTAAARLLVDGREHPEDFLPTGVGHSVGTWDGDTLVIDTTLLSEWNVRPWPRTEQTHIVERVYLTKLGAIAARSSGFVASVEKPINDDVLVVELTLTDPIYAGPQRRTAYYQRMSDTATLEWLPAEDYAARSTPQITSRDPLWHQPGLAEQVERGEHWLPGTATGRRETLVTSAGMAVLRHLIVLPGPSWLPVLAALGTAGFFLLLTMKWVAPAFAFGVLAIVCTIGWLWETDRPPDDVGLGEG